MTFTEIKKVLETNKELFSTNTNVVVILPQTSKDQ